MTGGRSSLEVRRRATRCPLCESLSVQRLFEKDKIPYYRCIACDFVFSRGHENPNLANVLDDYEPSYLQYLGPSLEDNENHAAFVDWINQFRSLEGLKLLDVGAGSGKLVRYLRQHGVEALGIEPAQPLFKKFLADDAFFEMKTLDEYLASATKGAFDVLLFCDVIEHVERPDILLCEASALLRPGGLLVVSTPDVQSVLARLIGKWWHYFNRYHLSYLSRQTMGRCAASCGLQEIGFDRLSRLKSLGYLAQYLLDFVIGAGRLRLSKRLNSTMVPINLFDTMYVAYEKNDEPSEIRAPRPPDEKAEDGFW